ncbi:MAG: plasmid pRiA4b ORF-3 family protein [Chloroflexota bacterium]
MQYELRVVLREIRPPIWRILEVPGNLTLDQLHQVLQVVMGWESAHLYLFQIDGRLYGEPNSEWDLPVADARTTTLKEVTSRTSSFSYEYDLGDSWMHEITVQRIVEGAAEGRPRCTGGARACPPEDCGGPSGYEYFLEAVSDPEHEEHLSMLEWAGDDFDPEEFDAGAIDRILSILL